MRIVLTLTMITIALLQVTGLMAFIAIYEHDMWRFASGMKPRPWEEVLLSRAVLILLPVLQTILMWQQIAPGFRFHFRATLSWRLISLLAAIYVGSVIIWLYSLLRYTFAAE